MPEMERIGTVGEHAPGGPGSELIEAVGEIIVVVAVTDVRLVVAVDGSEDIGADGVMPAEDFGLVSFLESAHQRGRSQDDLSEVPLMTLGERSALSGCGPGFEIAEHALADGVFVELIGEFWGEVEAIGGGDGGG